MFLPVRLPEENTRTMTDSWRGYNHNYRIQAGEWYDMENLTTDLYPVMAPRKKRAKLIQDEGIRGLLLTDNNITYLAGSVLHYGNRTYDLSEYGATGITEQKLLRFGAYILIYPMGTWVNVTNDEIGRMAASYSVASGTTITFSMCDPDGNPYSRITASTTAPANPQDGDYWLCTDPDSTGLNIWVAALSMWQPVATTYIKISIPGADLLDTFEEGDVVSMNSGISDINDGSEIIKLGSDYMVITGIIPDGVTHTEQASGGWTLTISRDLPDLDYVCTTGNRVWGCHYGRTEDGGILNEIYASALGDFRNWYKYAGLTTDSYAVSVGEDGPWTGCIAYQGHPIFFKENYIYKIYGSYPAEFQLYISNARGVQRGSDKSLAIVNEYLIYKSAADVVVYDGSSPKSISDALGNDVHYYDAVAGGTLGKYYISMETARGVHVYFVYDMSTGLWMREDADIKIREFTTSESGQIYADTGSEIYGIGTNENALFIHQLVGEEWVEWWAETGDLGLDYPDIKRISKIQLRAYVPHTSEIRVEISYDGQPFDEIAVVRGTGDIYTRVIDIPVKACDTYRIRMSGHGDVRVYSMTTTFDYEGGEQYGRHEF